MKGYLKNDNTIKVNLSKIKFKSQIAHQDKNITDYTSPLP